MAGSLQKDLNAWLQKYVRRQGRGGIGEPHCHRPRDSQEGVRCIGGRVKVPEARRQHARHPRFGRPLADHRRDGDWQSPRTRATP